MRAAFKAVQDGKQAAVLVPTTLLAQQHFQTFSDRFAGYPVRVEVLSRFLTTGPGPEGRRRAGRRRGRRGHRHPPAAVATTSQFKDLGLLVVDEEQRFGVTHKEPIKQLEGRRRRAHPDGHADPPHAGDEPHRHPRPHPAQHAAGRAPADPHLRRRVRRAGRGRGHPPRAAARGPGLLRAQPGAGHRARWPPSCGSWCPRPASPSPTARWTRARLEQVVLDFWEGEYDVLVCTTIIESGIDMPTVNTLVVDRADLLGPRPAPPAAGPGRPGRPAGLRLPVLPARPWR